MHQGMLLFTGMEFIMPEIYYLRHTVEGSIYQVVIQLHNGIVYYLSLIHI